MLGHSGAQCVAPAAARDVADGKVGGGRVEHGLDKAGLGIGLGLGLGLGLEFGSGLGLGGRAGVRVTG